MDKLFRMMAGNNREGYYEIRFECKTAKQALEFAKRDGHMRDGTELGTKDVQIFENGRFVWYI